MGNRTDYCELLWVVWKSNNLFLLLTGQKPFCLFCIENSLNQYHILLAHPLSSFISRFFSPSLAFISFPPFPPFHFLLLLAFCLELREWRRLLYFFSSFLSPFFFLFFFFTFPPFPPSSHFFFIFFFSLSSAQVVGASALHNSWPFFAHFWSKLTFIVLPS